MKTFNGTAELVRNSIDHAVLRLVVPRMTARYNMLRVTIVTALAAISCGLAAVFGKWEIFHRLTYFFGPLAVVCGFITYVLSQVKLDEDE